MHNSSRVNAKETWLQLGIRLEFILLFKRLLFKMFGNFLLTYSVYGKWTDFLYSVFLHYLNTLYNLPHSHKHIFLCVFLRKCFLSNVHTHLCSDGCIESNLGLCLTQRYHFPKQMICLADLAQVLCWLSYLMMKPYPFIWAQDQHQRCIGL